MPVLERTLRRTCGATSGATQHCGACAAERSSLKGASSRRPQQGVPAPNGLQSVRARAVGRFTCAAPAVRTSPQRVQGLESLPTRLDAERKGFKRIRDASGCFATFRGGGWMLFAVRTVGGGRWATRGTAAGISSPGGSVHRVSTARREPRARSRPDLPQVEWPGASPWPAAQEINAARCARGA